MSKLPIEKKSNKINIMAQRTLFCYAEIKITQLYYYF